MLKNSLQGLFQKRLTRYNPMHKSCNETAFYLYINVIVIQVKGLCKVVSIQPFIAKNNQLVVNPEQEGCSNVLWAMFNTFKEESTTLL